MKRRRSLRSSRTNYPLRLRRLALEPLESKHLLTGVGCIEEILVVEGTQTADHIIIEDNPDDADEVRVSLISRFTGVVIDQVDVERDDFTSIRIEGFAGDDLIENRTDIPAEINAGDGHDTIQGGSADDTLSGGDGDDFVYGRAGNDTIDGGAGLDALRGEQGDDYILGGLERDNIEGGAGDDTLVGGAGDDRYRYSSSAAISDWGHDTIIADASSGSDWLDFNLFDAPVTLDLLSTSPQTVAPGKLQLSLSAVDAIYGVLGSTFDDHITGNNRNNNLVGSDGNDTINAAGGADRVDGGAGDDDISGGASGDHLFGGTGDDTIDGGHGDDLITGDHGDDVLHGNFGDDILRGGYGDDVLHGNAGHDTLEGGDGFDRLDGGTENDVLDGGYDGIADELTGGGGADVFVQFFVWQNRWPFGPLPLPVETETITDYASHKDVFSWIAVGAPFKPFNDPFDPFKSKWPFG